MRAPVLRSDGLLLVTATIWGFAFVAQRAGMEHIGPFAFNAVRFALGSLFLIPFFAAAERRRAGGAGRPVSGRNLGLLGGGLAGVILFMGASLQQAGIVFTTAGKAGFITGIYVILVPILGLFLKHRTGRGTWVGAILALVGLYLLSMTGRLTLARGDLLVLCGAFFWAAHVLIIASLIPRMASATLAFIQYAVCAGLSLGAALLLEATTIEGLLGAAVPLLYSGLLSVGVAYTFQVMAQRHAPPAHAALILSLETVFAAVGGGLFLGERLPPRGLAGCGLILMGILLSELRRRGQFRGGQVRAIAT